MKIAAIYARVSSARQQRQETIASQVAALLDYAQAHDYQVSPHHIYQDEGYSGASLDRPALDRLRDAVAAGELEAVLDLVPGSLGTAICLSVCGDGRVRACGLPGGLYQPRLRYNTRGTDAAGDDRGVCEYERAQITERCRRGRLFHARQGRLWMPQAPYGYTISRRPKPVPGGLVINEAEAEVVRQMFHGLVDEQLSTYQITKRLNEAGDSYPAGEIPVGRGLCHQPAAQPRLHGHVLLQPAQAGQSPAP